MSYVWTNVLFTCLSVDIFTFSRAFGILSREEKWYMLVYKLSRAFRILSREEKWYILVYKLSRAFGILSREEKWYILVYKRRNVLINFLDRSCSDQKPRNVYHGSHFPMEVECQNRMNIQTK